MSERTRALGGGIEIPLLGLGTWRIADGREVEGAVAWALEAGYRHIDTAQGYGNEVGVGRSLRASGLGREEVFITTKFAPGRRRDPEAGLEQSLERLGIDRVDLYLVHWPLGGPTSVWPGMQRALERGLTRSIGVSNFDADELDALLAGADVPPAVNQIRLSPFDHRRELIRRCERHGTAVEAYSPLTRGEQLDDATVAGIASRHERTPAQVLLRWSLQHGFIVIPKSVRRERIVENAEIFDFVLPDTDMAVLDALDRTGGTGRALEDKWWTGRARARAAARRAVGRLRP